MFLAMKRHAGPSILLIALLFLSMFAYSPKTTQAWASNRPEVPLMGNTLLFLPKATYLGPASSTALTYITVTLAINTTGAEKYASTLYNGNSPNFRKFLTPEQFMAKFGPKQQALNSISTLLNALGFQISGVQFGDQFGFVTSIGAVESAFGVPISMYRYNGETFFANSQNPMVPSSVAPFIVAVDGLNNYTALATLTQNIQGFTTIIPADVYSFYQFNSAFSSGANGNGRKIGIVGYPGQGINLGDVTNFWTTYNIPWTSLTESTVNGGVPAVNTALGSGSMEMTLDAEWAGATGQEAGITVMTDNPPWWWGQSQYTQWYNEMSQIVNSLNPDVMSTSIVFALTDLSSSQITSIHNLMVQAVNQGITVVGASGDKGSAVLYDPSSDPYVTAEGGVSDTLTANTPGITGQTGWADSGGGPNTNFAQPSYQSSEKIKAPNNGYRDIPDISFPSAPSIALYFNGNWVGGYGGTSFAAPMFAGLVADTVTGVQTRVGLINNIMYDIPYGNAGCSYLGTSYSDVTIGNNGFNAGTGWDFVTGIGTPYAWNFIQAVDQWEYFPACR